jgi:hypothetical protein
VASPLWLAAYQNNQDILNLTWYGISDKLSSRGR